ncbi:MAG: ATP-binding protein [Phaeodactylibacter sp.]|nr:ATP-binding protein [Phaeodactylibacter sp.]
MKKLIIRDFGPIKDVNINLKEFTVFIGPQASGKSTISKSIYFFKSLRVDLLEYLIESIEKKKSISKPIGVFGRILRKKFLEFWGPTFHLQRIFLEYHYQNGYYIRITLEPKNRFIDPFFSESFRKEFFEVINDCNYFIDTINDSKESISTTDRLVQETSKRAFYTDLVKKVNSLFDEDRELIFIPAGRSVLTVLSEQISNISTKTSNIDYLMREFLDLVGIIKQQFNKGIDDIINERKLIGGEKVNYRVIRLAEKKINQILKGKYKNDKDGEKIYFSDSKYVKINYSSSGQQESLWILLVVFVQILYERKIFMVIEEPEAHLFPQAQKDILELIVLLFNSQRNQVIITTHSPYLLTALNNLLLANKLGKKKRKEVSEIVNVNYWLENDEFSSFFVRGGKLQDIYDQKIDQIKAEMIDSVSEVINEEYDRLFDLHEIEEYEL